MLSKDKMDLLTLPEQWDYLIGVETRLEAEVERDYSFCINFADKFRSTLKGDINSDHLTDASSFSQRITRIVSNNHELRILRSKMISVKEKHYQETQELLG